MCASGLCVGCAPQSMPVLKSVDTGRATLPSPPDVWVHSLGQLLRQRPAECGDYLLLCKGTSTLDLHSAPPRTYGQVLRKFLDKLLRLDSEAPERLLHKRYNRATLT